MSWVRPLADRLGTEEGALRFLLGILSAYPVLMAYNAFVRRKPASVHHVYFASTGIFVSYVCLGAEGVTHHGVCVLVHYAVLKAYGGTFAATCFLFVFQLGYLTAGYLRLGFPDEYLVDWIMPHCMVCLRLISISMDVYDGATAKDDGKDWGTKLAGAPSLLETTSHVFYLGSYFAGPHHSMTAFRRFVARNVAGGDMSGSGPFAARRFLLGWAYLGMHLAGNAVVPRSYLLSEAFRELPYWKLSLHLVVWSKSTLAMYASPWLFSEGACVVSGLGYNGRSRDGAAIAWNGAANMRLRLYESSCTFAQVVDSFHVSTNDWCRKYVYKRCRRLDSKLCSQVAALCFLSVWHGLRSGYCLTFFYELLVINFETEFFRMTGRSPAFRRIAAVPGAGLLFAVAGKAYVLFFFAHALLPFGLLARANYLPLVAATRAPILLFFGTWPLWKVPLAMILKPQRQPAANAHKKPD